MVHFHLLVPNQPGPTPIRIWEKRWNLHNWFNKNKNSYYIIILYSILYIQCLFAFLFHYSIYRIPTQHHIHTEISDRPGIFYCKRNSHDRKNIQKRPGNYQFGKWYQKILSKDVFFENFIQRYVWYGIKFH